MARRSLCENGAILVDNFVAEGETPPSELGQPRPHPDRIVVAGGSAVPALHGRHQDQESRVFELAVGNARRPAVLRTPDLEPDDVMPVVHDAHPVGLCVTDPERGFDDSHVLDQNFATSRCLTGSGTRPLKSPRSLATSLTSRLDT